MLERARKARGGDLGQRLGIGAPRVRRISGEEPGLHRAKAGDSKAFGAGQDLAGLHVVITPVGSCSGIEENRDDSKIDPRPCGFGCVGAGRDEGGAVNPAGREVAPTAMMGDSKIRIASSSRSGTSRKYRVSRRRTASDTISQRVRTAPALNSAAASLVEGTTLRAA